MKNTGTLKVTTPADDTIVMEREFNAPRHLVWKAMMEPELVKRWYGPRGHTLVVCTMDVRVGGKWRYVLRNPSGGEMGMRGEYRELTGPDRMITTEEFDDYPGEYLVTVTLAERDGKTTMRATVVYASQVIRDAVIASGMEHGAAETYDRLAELLPSIA